MGRRYRDSMQLIRKHTFNSLKDINAVRRKNREKTHQEPEKIDKENKIKGTHSIIQNMTQLQPRPFCIALIQRLSGRLYLVESYFEKYETGMPPAEFVSSIVNILNNSEALESERLRTQSNQCTDGDGDRIYSRGIKKPVCPLATDDELYSAISRCIHKPLTDGSQRHKQPKHINRQFECDITILMDKWNGSSLSQLGTADILADPILVKVGLWHLFKQVDCTSRGCIFWDEFIVYLLDTIMKTENVLYRESNRTPFRCALTRVSPAFYRAGLIVHSPTLKVYVVLIKGKEAAVASSKENQMMRIIDDVTLCQKRTIPLVVNAGKVLSICVIEPSNLALSYSDGCIRICDAVSGVIKLAGPPYQCRLSTPHNCNESCPNIVRSRVTCAQTKLSYAKTLNGLFVGSRNGDLSLLDITLLDKSSIPGQPAIPIMKWCIQPHTSVVTDIAFVSSGHKYIATASLDCTICLINFDKLTSIRKLLGHNAGITCLVHNPQFNFLISAGVEYDPLCWAINVSNSKPFALRDGRAPHTQAIVSLITIPHSSFVVSLDRTGMIKYWDLKAVVCVQTIHCEYGSLDPPFSRTAPTWRACAYNERCKQLLTTAKRKVSVFEGIYLFILFVFYPFIASG